MVDMGDDGDVAQFHGVTDFLAEESQAARRGESASVAAPHLYNRSGSF